MIFDRNFDRLALGLTTALLAASTLVAAPAYAHPDDHFGIGGKSIKMGWSEESASDAYFKFKASNQLSINSESIEPDPRGTPSSLIVRGTGAFAGTSEIIRLNGNKWTRIGSDEKPKGWRYSSDEYDTHSGGIRKIQIKGGTKSGSLMIQAKGYYWPYEIPGPQDSIEVVLTIGSHVFCAEFSEDRQADFKTNLEGEVQATDSIPPADCPIVCGNGVVETGEECDDNNSDPNDTCTNECLGCNPANAVYDTTFEGIQQLIFDGYDCSNDACHGSAQEGGLDLREGNSFDSLINVASESDDKVRVFPGDQDESVLFLKLAAATQPGYEPTTGGSPMPFTGTPITADQLEAVRLWIRGGAPETGVVAGTAELLGSCLPPPTPLNIPQPDPPAPAVGTQFAMPGYNLMPGEVEGCVASYYDISDDVPASMMVDCPGVFPGTNDTGTNAGKCFTYNANRLYQDAQSHHSIVHIYPGNSTWSNPGWGSWRCYGGPTPNAGCDPSTANPCGTGGVCGSSFHKGVACLDFVGEDWGAPDFNTSTSPTFSGSQESTASLDYPDGVYSMLPLKGLIVWNSHAFNLTSQATDMNAWINMTYTDDRQHQARGLFNDTWIFTQNVPPFERREYCATHTFAQNTHLFQLSSHNHKRGVRWQYYEAPQTPCSGPGSCSSAGSGTPFFTSYDYSDPRVDLYDPPKVYSGTVAERTIKFCALYDNGFTDPDTVKLRSQSPVPTGSLPIGGPCTDSDVECVDGTNMGELCHGNNEECPGSTKAIPCDACPLKGGVTTEDEMFIAIGTYYIP